MALAVDLLIDNKFNIKLIIDRYNNHAKLSFKTSATPSHNPDPAHIAKMFRLVILLQNPLV